MLFEIFIKTFDKLEYAENFLENGTMRFSHVSYYQAIEDDNVRGDGNEGGVMELSIMQVPKNVKTITIGNESGKQFILDWQRFKRDHPEYNTAEPLTFKISYTADIHIYCITYINDQMKNVNEIIDACKKFGDYSVVITDCHDFIDKIKKSIPECEIKQVKYSDNDKKDIFTKSTIFRNQSECRVAIHSKSTDALLFNIGKLNGFLCESSRLQEMGIAETINALNTKIDNQ